MLVKDSQKIVEHIVKNAEESERDKLARWEQETIESSILVEDDVINPGNVEMQMGRAYTNKEFEDKLIKLNPNLVFRTFKNLEGNLARGIYRTVPGGVEPLLGYEHGIVPEHSIRRVYTKDVMENPNKRIHLDRKDINAKWDENKKEFVYDGPAPGMKRIKVSDRELKRGWRTVLYLLMQKGILNLNAVEKEFGSSNRQTWAYATGKAGVTKPW